MAPVYGLHCSHEQIPPSRLLAHAIEAETAGFGAAMSSDHFSPWSERQGESGFSFAFLGAAMQATSTMSSALHPRERSMNGFSSPCTSGPRAVAPARRSVSL